ncbi:hypothetical protein WN51_13703 [Melipona quadrifasciata]|uniref:Uncharacterized protein n=1 Tax=Melipona quadrifasciata TaxID=166423 RepID=A0A0M9A040_9HYME|nr:hypothetical protein WN51_13703 [Melipona quadrifasciata]
MWYYYFCLPESKRTESDLPITILRLPSAQEKQLAPSEFPLIRRDRRRSKSTCGVARGSMPPIGPSQPSSEKKEENIEKFINCRAYLARLSSVGTSPWSDGWHICLPHSQFNMQM